MTYLQPSAGLRLWHVTPHENLSGILKGGLEPRIGPRSRLMAERVKAIYFFPDSLSIQDALANWFGDELAGQKASLLEVSISRDWIVETPEICWEQRVIRIIPPDCIRVLIEDLDQWTGEYPGEAPEEWSQG